MRSFLCAVQRTAHVKVTRSNQHAVRDSGKREVAIVGGNNVPFLNELAVLVLLRDVALGVNAYVLARNNRANVPGACAIGFKDVFLRNRAICLVQARARAFCCGASRHIPNKPTVRAILDVEVAFSCLWGCGG